MKTPFARIAAGLTALALATAGLNVAVTIAAPVVAQASTVNGPITRGEVLARAQAWVDSGYTYNTNASAPGPGDGRAYRKDCSGLVAMTWHLSTSYDTTDFKAKAQNNDGMHVIGLNDLQPGDAVVRDPDGHGGEGHMELFAYWKNQSDHSQGAYVYSFNSTGETVRNPYHNSNFGNLGFDSWSELTTYIPIRYNQIGSGSDTVAWVTAQGGLQIHAGDGPYAGGVMIDSTPNADEVLVAGDWNGDGKDTVAWVTRQGGLQIHAGDGPYAGGVMIDANPRSDEVLVAGDWDGA
jgi:hypothetical protein